MTAYRVCVKSYVVVEATNQHSAAAVAEVAVRRAVEAAYREDGDASRPRFADRWDRFGFLAIGKAERVPDDE